MVVAIMAFMGDDKKTTWASSVLPLVAALLGTLAGGAVTYWTTSMEIGANRQQALAARRETAYGSFMTDAVVFFSEQYPYIQEKSLRIALPSQQGNLIISTVNKLETDSSSVALIGPYPSDTSRLSSQLSALAGQIAIQEHLIHTSEPVPGGRSIGDLIQNFDSRLNTVRRLMNKIVENG